MSVTEQKRGKRILMGQDNNALTWLIILNSVVFATILFIKIVFDITNGPSATTNFQIDSYVALPAEGYQLLTRPWTIITFMFAHNSIWYFISSLLWLWSFGYILQDMAGNNKLFPIYLYGGICGAIFFLITANLIPSIHSNAASYSLLGAGTSIMAVAIATTTIAPRYRIFPMINGGIPLWVLTLVYVAISFGTIGISNGAVAMAEIVSGLTGFFFIYQMKRGNDMSRWLMNFYDWMNNLFNPEKKHHSNELYYAATRKPFEKTAHFSQQKLDEILDKINEEGYHFLSDDEKDFLKKASQQDL